MPTFIVCQNDGTECVVIGSEEFANEVMKNLKEENDKKVRKDYGEILADEYIHMQYWHLHGPLPIKIESDQLKVLHSIIEA